VECKHAEPKDSSSSSQLMGDVATAAAGGAMILAQAADGTVGLVPASALQASASLRQGSMAMGPAAAAGGVGLMSSTDLSAAAAATYRAHDLLQPSLLNAGQYSIASIMCIVAATIVLHGMETLLSHSHASFSFHCCAFYNCVICAELCRSTMSAVVCCRSAVRDTECWCRITNYTAVCPSR